MSNWDLMMPGMGLTSIGLAGVVISYSGIAHTFIDGMHALTGLTMFIGLIFLAAGILQGGVSTSNKSPKVHFTRLTALVPSADIHHHPWLIYSNPIKKHTASSPVSYIVMRFYHFMIPQMEVSTASVLLVLIVTMDLLS